MTLAPERRVAFRDPLEFLDAGMRGRIGLAAAASVAALVLVESALRIRPPQVASAWIIGTHKRVLDPDLIYVNPQHVDPSFYRRDPKLPTVVTLGDSFTESYPVGAERSYPSCLERILARRGHPANVVNLGSGDSGPDQQLRLLERYALQYTRPDVVIWQFYENDVWDNITKAVFDIENGRLVPIPAADNWMYKRQLFYDATPLPRSVKRHSFIYQYILKGAEHWAMAQVPPAYASTPERWAKEKIRLEIEEMERLARARGFRVYYVAVPPQAMSMNTATDASGDDAIRIEKLKTSHPKLRAQIAAQPGYIELDFERHGRARAPRPTARPKPGWQRLYVHGDQRDHHSGLGSRHLNEAGYRAMARQIARRIAKTIGSSAEMLRRSAQAPLETGAHMKN
jgi:lysophospholipase L1-like esterase